MNIRNSIRPETPEALWIASRLTVCSCGVSVFVWCAAIVRVNTSNRSRVPSQASHTVAGAIRRKSTMTSPKLSISRPARWSNPTSLPTEVELRGLQLLVTLERGERDLHARGQLPALPLMHRHRDRFTPTHCLRRRRQALAGHPQLASSGNSDLQRQRLALDLLRNQGKSIRTTFYFYVGVLL